MAITVRSIYPDTSKVNSFIGSVYKVLALGTVSYGTVILFEERAKYFRVLPDSRQIFKVTIVGGQREQ